MLTRSLTNCHFDRISGKDLAATYGYLQMLLSQAQAYGIRGASDASMAYGIGLNAFAELTRELELGFKTSVTFHLSAAAWAGDELAHPDLQFEALLGASHAYQSADKPASAMKLLDHAEGLVSGLGPSRQLDLWVRRAETVAAGGNSYGAVGLYRREVLPRASWLPDYDPWTHAIRMNAYAAKLLRAGAPVDMARSALAESAAGAERDSLVKYQRVCLLGSCDVREGRLQAAYGRHFEADSLRLAHNLPIRDAMKLSRDIRALQERESQ